MKNLLVAFFFTCFSWPVFGQFSIGLSAGANYTFWKWHIKPLDVNLDFDPAVAYRASLLGEWQMSSMFALRAEISQQVKSNKTSDLTFPDMVSTATYRENYRFWEGSLLAQVSPVRKIHNCYFLAGATFGRLTKGWSSIMGDGPEFEDSPRKLKNDIDISNPNFNRGSIAADFGLGGNIPLGKRSSIKLEARYQYGFSNFSGNENVDASADPFLFSAGYLHRL